MCGSSNRASTRGDVAIRYRAVVVLGVALLGLTSVREARADEPAKIAASPPNPANPAEVLADQAFKKYEAGATAEAIALYMQAYDLSKAPRILFNLGQIYDKKLHDREVALTYYRRYLKTENQEPELARRAVDRAYALAAEEPVSPKPKAASSVTARPTSPDRSPPYWIGWASAGVLAAGAVTTGILATTTASDMHDATFVGTPPDSVSADRSRAKTFAILTDVLGVGAVVCAGVTLYVTLTHKKTSTAAFVTQHPWLGGRF